MVCRKRGAKREHDRAEREWELFFTAFEEDVHSYVSLLAVKDSRKQAIFRHHGDGGQIFIIKIKVIAKCFFCVCWLIRLSLHFQFLYIT